jgi:hypothetical protein
VAVIVVLKVTGSSCPADPRADGVADCAAGLVDLSRAAFARIADPRAGLVAVSYRTALDPPLPGPLVLRIFAAARPGTLAVQVINHRNRLSSVAASRPAGRWQRLAPGADGYWTGPLPIACPGGAGGPPRRAGRAYGQLLTSPAISGPAGRA